MAREKGILEDWHDARGFGFIRRPAGGKLYVHMKAIGKSNERPKAGDILSYEVGTGANGRPAAVEAQIIRPLQSKTAGIAPGKGSERVAAQPTRREAKPGLVRISIRTAAAATIIALLASNILQN
ncbi:MAG: cold shock domain-containing protein, partial [Hyphomonadaceae bacterium]